MAKPQYYPDWATDDVNLPSTGKTNKVRPREIIRTTGWDKGQIPTAEEMNWMFNNWGLWIHYFQDEYLPTIPETYLPKNGTNLVFTGDLTGQIDWTGSNQGTGNIQVVDNSHNHISANISDATDQAVANVLVKRAGNGSFWAGRAIYGSANDGQNFDLFMTNSSGQIQASVNYSQASDQVQIYLGYANGQTPRSRVTLSDGHVEIHNPRSLFGQEGQANSLVRFDYLNSRLSDLNTNLVNYTNSRTQSALGGDNGWWRDYNSGLILQWGIVTYSQLGGHNFYIPFHFSFPNYCAQIQLNNYEDFDAEGNTWRIRGKDQSGFRFDNGGGNMFTAYMWFAIGY